MANNSIITGLRGNEDEKLQLFKEVHGQYQPAEILERQGNLVLMRLIPLARNGLTNRHDGFNL